MKTKIKKYLYVAYEDFFKRDANKRKKPCKKARKGVMKSASNKEKTEYFKFITA